MTGTLKKLKYKFSLEAAIDEGFSYEDPPPVLSPEKRDQLLGASSLETPRSVMRSAAYVLTPYWKKSSASERAIALGLLGASIAMAFWAVQVTVDFGAWQSELTNSVMALFQNVDVIRSVEMENALEQTPLLKEVLNDHKALHEVFEFFPHLQSIANTPNLDVYIENYDEIAGFLSDNPQMKTFLTNTRYLDSIMENYQDLSQLLQDHYGLGDFLKERPPLDELLERYPDLEQVFENNLEIKKLITSYPDFDMIDRNYDALSSFLEGREDLQSVAYNYPTLARTMERYPELIDTFVEYPDLRRYIMDYPSLEKIVENFPGLEGTLAQRPELLDEVRTFSAELADRLSGNAITEEKKDKIWDLAGSNFVSRWSDAFNGASKSALQKAWDAKDLVTIALKFTAMSIASYKSSQFLMLRWRAWSTGYYTNRWMSSASFARLKERFSNIDNPAQRIQEDPAKFTAGAMALMTGGVRDAITMGSFSGVLWGMGTVAGVPGAMFWAAALYATALTGITLKAGWKLPGIQRNQQRIEADLREAINSVHVNAELIAQNNSEDVEKELIKNSLRPVMKNSVREIGTQVKLITVDATAGNLSIPVPYIAGAYAISEGVASMGTVQQLNYAFNRIASSMSFLVNRFELFSQMKATADRIYLMDQAVEASRYVEEEKRQAGNHKAKNAFKPI